MSNVIPFDFKNHSIRVISNDPINPLFVAYDVAGALGYKNKRQAIIDHCKGVAIHDSLQTKGGKQKVRVIPEPDLYRLIFGSKLESAQQFQDWVVEEVLPEIRKTGKYEIPKTLSSALMLASNQAEEIEKAKPKLEAYNRIAEGEGSLTVTQAAKTLQISPKKLFSWLSVNQWTYRRVGSSEWTGYQTKIDAQYLEHKVATLRVNDSDDRVFTQVRVTPRGLSKLAEVLNEPQRAEV